MRFGVVVFPGTWSDADFQYVIAEVLQQPVRAVWHRERTLDDLDCVILPGGFSYGDYLRAGAVAARAPVVEALPGFVARGGLVLGSCNGFQILCEAGLLPGVLTRNAGLRYRCQTVSLRVESAATPFTRELRVGDVVAMPISHGEGRYQIAPDELAGLERDGRIILRYATADGRVTAEANPNGSVDNIAGIASADGRVFGLMPHPERAAEATLGGTGGLGVFRSLLARELAPR